MTHSWFLICLSTSRASLGKRCERSCTVESLVKRMSSKVLSCCSRSVNSAWAAFVDDCITAVYNIIRNITKPATQPQIDDAKQTETDKPQSRVNKDRNKIKQKGEIVSFRLFEGIHHKIISRGDFLQNCKRTSMARFFTSNAGRVAV